MNRARRAGIRTHNLLGEDTAMNKCTFCGREAIDNTRYVGGYEILDCCTDCEDEILNAE